MVGLSTGMLLVACRTPTVSRAPRAGEVGGRQGGKGGPADADLSTAHHHHGARPWRGLESPWTLESQSPFPDCPQSCDKSVDLDLFEIIFTQQDVI